MQKSAIKVKFVRYVNFAAKRLRHYKSPSRRTGPRIRLAYISPSALLPSLANKLESSMEFKALADTVHKQFPTRQLYENMRVMLFANKALGNFFRRSGLYLKLFDGKKVRSQDYFELLWSALSLDTIPLRTFVLISSRFGKSVVDCGDFRIQKFSRAQLDKLTGNQINRMFYPEATINTQLLSYFWFVSWRNGDKGNLLKDDPKTPIMRDFPEEPIQWLAAYDWLGQPKQNFGFGSLGLKIPFSFVVEEDLLREPFQPHPLCQVKDFPAHIIEAPEFYGKKLNTSHVNELISTIQLMKQLSKISCISRWDFIGLAMGYLAKALVTDDKLEQIMWNFCVLEALFGAGEGVRQAISRRLSTFLASSKAEGERLVIQFDKIYKLRCDLVHTNTFEKEPTFETVTDSRELARRGLFWFAEYLSTKKIFSDECPRRSSVLKWMDRQFEQKQRATDFSK
jgi:hypothetical protein